MLEQITIIITRVWPGPPLPATWGQPILQWKGPSNKEIARNIFFFFGKSWCICKRRVVYVIRFFIYLYVYSYTCIMCATHTWSLRDCVPIVCLCASCVPFWSLSLCPIGSWWVEPRFKPASSAPPIQQEIYARPWEPIDLHVDDVVGLAGKYCWAKLHDSCWFLHETP